MAATCLFARHKHITQDYENKLMYFGSVDGVLAMYPVRTWHLIHTPNRMPKILVFVTHEHTRLFLFPLRGLDDYNLSSIF
jgi:hypothetical protein